MNYQTPRTGVRNLGDLRRFSQNRQVTWDAGHPQRNNTKAAARAAHYLAPYVDSESGGEIDSGFRDLLNDLRHLADALGLDFDTESASAQRSYRDEIAGRY
ncbi:MAG: hypothetical protein WAV90_02475 [Gordonia amarae]